MKNLELEGFGLVEMEKENMANMNGGWFQAALAITGAAIYLYNEGGDFIKGFKEGYNGRKVIKS